MNAPRPGTPCRAAVGRMLSRSGHFVGSARTARDGTYTVTGLPAAAPGYTVCFEASNATGGNSSHGYAGQCCRNVPVTAGALTPGADAALDVTIATNAKDLASKVP
jgi:hypothetical protein